jgi:superfamily II DNA or RNA helicase
MGISSENKANLDQFIVDNKSDSVTVGAFLTEWCQVSSELNIATGYFDTRAFDSLEPGWRALEKIRLLMGAEVTSGVRSQILKAVKAKVLNELETTLTHLHPDDPLMAGPSQVQKAIIEGKIETKVYTKTKFHAKAYFTVGNEALPRKRALVGSSNFTHAGLNRNLELNVQVSEEDKLAQLERWYKSLWDEAEDLKEDVLKILQRHTREVSPFEIYGRALTEFFANEQQTTNEWEETKSKIFPLLDDYQKEGYWQMVNIVKRFNGGLLCDGVGLGKTFIGLMLIERLVHHENKNVILLAPKSVKEGVWAEELAKKLPLLSGKDKFQDFSNLTVLSHTDLRKNNATRIRRLVERADAIVIDEAHHFRNMGKNPSDKTDVETMNRWWQLFSLANMSKSKPVYMLTATPINNSLADFRNLLRIFTNDNDGYFKDTLGVNSVRGEISKIETQINRRMEAILAGEPMELPTDEIFDSPLFENLVVQRSRIYAKRSQKRQYGNRGALVFPKREVPRVAEYSLVQTYGDLFEIFEEAMDRKARRKNGEEVPEPLFTLPIYSQVDYLLPGVELENMEIGRRKQIVELIRINFMKRFESSVYAFEQSSARLLLKILQFMKLNAQKDEHKNWMSLWASSNEDLNVYIQTRLKITEDQTEEDQDEEDMDILDSLDVEGLEELDSSKFNVDQIIEESKSDIDLLTKFLRILMKSNENDDDKIQTLIQLLQSDPDLVGKKVMIFTEFSDTARYIHRRLSEAGITKLEVLDSKSKSDRAEVLRRFSPYYNDSNVQNLAKAGKSEIDVLVATDVLSEGLNLQDATRLINYDIHWNPVRLMQRIGRVDRRLNPEIEKELKKAYPERASDRGHVIFWNFLPPKELKKLLTLWHKVRTKTAYISYALGLESPILHPDDHYNSLKEFGVPEDFETLYDGRFSDHEKLKLELQNLRDSHAEEFEIIDNLPDGSFSGKLQIEDLEKGVFFCLRIPGLDKAENQFTYEAGTTEWLLYNLVEKRVIEKQGALLAPAIKSELNEKRVISTPNIAWGSPTSPVWQEAWTAIQDYVHNTTLRRLQMPLDAPEPKLICWMELN